jgi:hypothetical protein
MGLSASTAVNELAAKLLSAGRISPGGPPSRARPPKRASAKSPPPRMPALPRTPSRPISPTPAPLAREPPLKYPILRTTLPVSAAVARRVLLEPDFMAALKDAQGTSEMEGMSELRVDGPPRELRFRRLVTSKVSPVRTCRVVEVQTAAAPDGELVLECTQEFKEIPFSDCFTTRYKVCVAPCAAGCDLSVSLEVIFQKRMLLRAICETSTVSEFTDNINHLPAVINAKLRALAPAPIEPPPQHQHLRQHKLVGTAAPAC